MQLLHIVERKCSTCEFYHTTINNKEPWDQAEAESSCAQKSHIIPLPSFSIWALVTAPSPLLREKLGHTPTSEGPRRREAYIFEDS